MFVNKNLCFQTYWILGQVHLKLHQLEDLNNVNEWDQQITDQRFLLFITLIFNHFVKHGVINFIFMVQKIGSDIFVLFKNCKVN